MPKGEVRAIHGRDLRALLLSLPALAVPALGAFLFPESLQDYEALLWLLALIPAFLLACHRGWQGVATALALGMAVISITYAITQWAGSPLPDLLLAVVVAYLAIALGIGWLSEGVGRRAARESRAALALHDELTELPTRRQAEVHLAQELASAPEGRSLSVVLFDLDRFGEFNEANGRAAGDGVLRSFGTLLRQTTRRMNLAARWGAEEFICVLAGCDEAGALTFAARVQERLRAAESTVALPTVSAGIASYRPGLDTPQQLLRAAEDALLLAKEQGRDRVRVHGRTSDPLEQGWDEVAQTSPEAPPLLVAPLEAAHSTPAGAGEAALVLAADAALRAQLAQALEAEAFAVTAAESWLETLPRLGTGYAVALVELSAGVTNAGDVVRELRTRLPEVRVIGVPLVEEGLATSILSVPVHAFHLPSSPPAQLRALLHELVREVVAERARRTEARQISEEARARERAARQAVAASEARYHGLLQSIQQVIFTADAEGRWTFLNPAWTAITGYNVEESLGEPVWERVHEEDRGALLAGFQRMLRHRSAHFRHEGRWRTRTGEYRWIEARFQFAPASAGQPEGATGVLTDITERRTAEQALRHTEGVLSRAQKMESIGRLAGGVAHDFNNLLTAVLGHAELLLEETPEGTPMLRTGLLEIRSAAERATTLTRQLLAFSRKQVLQARVLDVNLVVAEVERMLRHTIGEDIQLVPELAAPLDLVRADPAQLEQVVLNLVVNARDAAGSGGRIVLRTGNRKVGPEGVAEADVPPGEYVMLEVEDNGCGMSPETAAQAFEPFFTTRPGVGSGLGLSTVYGIVKQSGGHVWLTSRPDAGTRVTVYLPRAADGVPPVPAAVGAAPPVGGTETILLVEDEQSVRELARRILERRGYHVLVAENGREALELQASYEEPIHLLLSDVVMPEMHGPELADQLAPLRPGMKVLLMSGYAEEAVRQRGAFGDDREFMEKPFAPDELLGRVRSVLDGGERTGA